MKNLAMSAVGLALAAACAPLSAVEVDGIAATVGAQTILRSEVRNELRRAGLDDSHFAVREN